MQRQRQTTSCKRKAKKRRWVCERGKENWVKFWLSPTNLCLVGHYLNNGLWVFHVCIGLYSAMSPYLFVCLAVKWSHHAIVHFALNISICFNDHKSWVRYLEFTIFLTNVNLHMYRLNFLGTVIIFLPFIL